jgi:hypothetical protein
MAARTYQGITDSSGNANIYRKSSGTETALILGQTGYGVDFKAWGLTATTDYMQWDSSASQLQLTAALPAYNSMLLYAYGTPTSVTAGSRTGTVNITTRRDIAWTSGWDGNADIGLKVLSYNYSVSGAYGRIEGFEVLARNRTGSCYSVHGGYVTAENYNGAGNIADMVGLEVHSKQNSVATGNVKAMRIMDESGSSTGTHYGIELTTGDGAFMKLYGIHINSAAVSGSGWTNAISFNDAITNVFDFENSDGTNGATLKAGTYSGSGNSIKIQVDCAGTTYYLIAHATVS